MILKGQCGQAIVVWVCSLESFWLCAFAMDMGLLFRASRMAQAAVTPQDCRRGGDGQRGHGVGCKAGICENGVTNGVNGAVVTVNNPPTLGKNTGNLLTSK